MGPRRKTAGQPVSNGGVGVRSSVSSYSGSLSDVTDSGGQVVLKKQINLFHCVSIIVGIIVGAGIFVSPVGITKHVRSVGE